MILLPSRIIVNETQFLSFYALFLLYNGANSIIIPEIKHYIEVLKNAIVLGRSA